MFIVLFERGQQIKWCGFSCEIIITPNKINKYFKAKFKLDNKCLVYSVSFSNK